MKQQRGVSEWKNWVFENGSYKLVALFVTLILWITILGRRDFVLSKDMDIEFLVPRSITVAPAPGQKEVERRVTVKVSGPRMALKRFAQNPGTITIDLAKSQPGPVQAIISPRSVEVPFGVKVLSVTPNVVMATLIRAAGEEVLSPDQSTPGPVEGDRADRADRTDKTDKTDKIKSRDKSDPGSGVKHEEE